MSYDPIKKIDVSPLLYSKEYEKININQTDPLTKKPFSELIDNTSSKGIHYILGRTGDGSEMINYDGLELRRLHLNKGFNGQKYNQIFYFTIKDKLENNFKYIGKQSEINKEKQYLLNTFFDAQEGNMEARLQLGDYYAKEGAHQDFSEAANFYRLAALQGSAEGLKKLDQLTQYGLGDLESAVDCFRQLAKLGNPQAMNLFAYHLENGSGIEKDIDRALKYYHLAAVKDNPDATLSLAFHYAETENYEKAAQMILQFSKLGFIISTKEFDERLQELGDNDLPQEFAAFLDLLT